MRKKEGISLIILVITIIIIIILAGTVILSLANNNLITKATESKFKINLDAYNSELAMAISNEFLNDYSFKPETFNIGTWDGGDIEGTIKEYIPCITEVDGLKFEIQGGTLVYVGTNETEQDWLTNMGMVNGEVTPPQEQGLGVDQIATENTTVNGEAEAYNNPIIPVGFKAVNTTDASWSNITTDWDKGLVIEDASGNQFVWVPVDGTNVTYSKWCTTGLSYASTLDDTLPTGIIYEIDQINSYGGFYIARYESAFDYNGGNTRVASKISINKTISNWTRDSSHTGYLFNFIDYTDARIYSENMATSYSYDVSKIKSGLITGTQWDTAMKWIQNANISVTDSRTWGNHSDSIAPANVGNGILQISGFSENWKAKNIYDLAGNTFEWTNEIYSSFSVYRGGIFNNSGSGDSAALRFFNTDSYVSYYMSFRVVLYIL